MKPLTNIEREKLRVVLEDWAYDAGLASQGDPDQVGISPEDVERLIADLHEVGLAVVREDQS